MTNRIEEMPPPRKRLPLLTLGPAHFVLLGVGVLLVLLIIWIVSVPRY